VLWLGFKCAAYGAAPAVLRVAISVNGWVGTCSASGCFWILSFDWPTVAGHLPRMPVSFYNRLQPDDASARLTAWSGILPRPGAAPGRALSTWPTGGAGEIADLRRQCCCACTKAAACWVLSIGQERPYPAALTAGLTDRPALASRRFSAAACSGCRWPIPPRTAPPSPGALGR